MGNISPYTMSCNNVGREDGKLCIQDVIDDVDVDVDNGRNKEDRNCSLVTMVTPFPKTAMANSIMVDTRKEFN